MAGGKKGRKKGQRGRGPANQRPAAKKAGKATAKQTTAKQTGRTTGKGTAEQPTVEQPTAEQPGTEAGAPPASPKGPSSQRARPPRAARIEAARRARRRKALLLRLLLGVVIVALIGVFVLNTIGNRREANALERRLTAGDCTFDTESDRTDRPPNNHVSSPTYEVNPPAGGNHSSQAADAGTYEEGNVPPDGQLVHSLEHGYIVFWHQPTLSEAERQDLQRVVDRYERDVLLVPRASMPTKVAATAWGRRLLCPGVETGPLGEFVENYRNEGPEKVPH